MGTFFRFLTSKYFVLQIVVAIIITIAIVFGLVQYLDTYTLHGNRKVVPDLTDYHYTEIEGIMKEAELKPVIYDSIFSSEKKPGIILGQNPKPGTEVKPQRKIYLTINSLTTPKVVLPALKDLTFRQARSRILSYGLNIDSVEYRPAECTNCVVDIKVGGKKAERGTELDRGTAVTIVVGSGESEIKIDVPHLYGLRLDEAEEHLLNKGLNTGIVRFDNTVETKEDSSRAVVFQQSPEFRSKATINLGNSIDLQLTADSSKVPEPELQKTDSLPEIETANPPPRNSK